MEMMSRHGSRSQMSVSVELQNLLFVLAEMQVHTLYSTNDRLPQRSTLIIPSCKCSKIITLCCRSCRNASISVKAAILLSALHYGC